MTIDRDPYRRHVRWLAAVAIVAACWFGLIVALTFTSQPGHSIAIIGSPVRAMEAVAAANGRVMNVRGFVTIARSDEADFVARLYAAGALLVIDAEQAGGCSGLPPKRIAAKA